MVEHAFIMALGPPKRDERISSTMTRPGIVSAPIAIGIENVLGDTKSQNGTKSQKPQF